MARQMAKQEEEVPLLALLDTYNLVRSSNHVRSNNRGFSLVWMLAKKHIHILQKSDWKGRRDYLRYYRREFGSNLRLMFQTILKTDTNTNGSSGNLPSKFLEWQQVNTQAILEYEPQSYPGRVILFKALRGKSASDPTNGWNRVDLGELKIHQVDCYHGGILFEPAVSQVAEQLNLYIKDAAQ